VIDENKEVCEKIIKNLNIKKNPTIQQLNSYFISNQINNKILINDKNIINNNNIINNIIYKNKKENQNQNGLNYILIINCVNIKRLFIGCIYYGFIYVENMCKYVTSLFNPIKN
jgi:hypothetical protein